MRFLTIIVCLLAAMTAARADDAVKVDFTAIVSEDGTTFPDDVQCPLRDGQRLCDAKLTLGHSVYYALMMPEPNISWDENIRRYDLARGVRDAADWPLSRTDRDLIKKQLPKLWGPAFIGAAAKMLEPQK